MKTFFKPMNDGKNAKKTDQERFLTSKNINTVSIVEANSDNGSLSWGEAIFCCAEPPFSDRVVRDETTKLYDI